MNFTINTEIEIKTVNDLKQLRKLMEVNDMNKPNFSAIATQLGVCRQTVAKYYNQSDVVEPRKKKASVMDQYYEIIKALLSENSIQLFHYKSHLFRYLQREHKLDCSRSNFDYYINNHDDFSSYFKKKKSRKSIKSETSFGKQAQFDWKEKLNFTLNDGTNILFNVGSLVLSASRLKVWLIYPSMNQENLFDFLANAFELIGGVPEEILIDNASTMMDVARTESSLGKINNKFSQLANDYGFKITPCIRARPNTKAKVENPMRVIDEIMGYNGVLGSIEELYSKFSEITEESNKRICQATGLPPIVVFKKEKAHLLPLPHSKIRASYKKTNIQVKVNINSLFSFKTNLYSVPPDLIGKIVTLEVNDNNLYVYYNKNLITVHKISDNKINYQVRHHEEIMGITFKSKSEETILEYANNHFKELEKFNEQLSEVSY